MDFALSKEQSDIQAAAMDFARGEFDPDAALMLDEQERFPSDIRKKACELGFIGVHYPEDCGGADLGLLENALIAEAFCRQDSGIGTALVLSDFGAELIVRNGSEEQMKSYLPRVAGGESILTVACLEEGYALLPLTTTAKRDKDGYLVQGSKSFVPLASLADHLIVLCQDVPGEAGTQSMFLAARNSPGIGIEGMGRKVGMRMIPADRVFFEAVRIPGENLLGREGEGRSQVEDFILQMRIESAGMAVGIAQGGLDRALDYSRRREAFGRAIVQFEVTRNKLADMHAETELARLVTYKAAWSYDRGSPDRRLSLIARMTASETAYRVTDHALQIHGGQGYMTEGHIEHFYRDAKMLGLFLEPASTQRRLLGDEVAGKAG